MPSRFRIRVHLSRNLRIQSDMPKFSGRIGEPAIDVVISVPNEQLSIKESEELIFSSALFQTEAEAATFGSRFLWATKLFALTKGLPIDFGDGPPQFVLSRAGERYFAQQYGHPVAWDKPGLMIVDDVPGLRFMSGSATAVVGFQIADLVSGVSAFFRDDLKLTDREMLAVDLAIGSFFEKSARAKFLMLMTAFESILELKPRPELSRRIVREFRDILRMSGVEASEKQSLLGGLGWLEKESIHQTGRRQSREVLAGRTYGGMDAERFFDECYGLRSDMTHGRRGGPQDEDARRRIYDLRRMVSDMVVEVVRRRTI